MTKHRSTLRAVNMLLLVVLAPLTIANGSTARDIKTLPNGAYFCQRNVYTDGTGADIDRPWIASPEDNFTITNSSTYRTNSGSGTYLFVRKVIIFTYGPLNGRRFQSTGTHSMRILENGRLGDLSCARNHSTSNRS